MRLILLIFIVLLTMVGCRSTDADLSSQASETSTGTLTFVANGEDFVRDGFVSKDGWQISFDHLFVNLAEIRAYQTDPPYDASTGKTIEGQEVHLEKLYSLNLVPEAGAAELITIDIVEDAPSGQYNALSWQMINGSDGEMVGTTLRLQGTATKADRTVTFMLHIKEEYSYACGEYVGDTRKGFLSADGTTSVEITFHFDHVFGDGDLPLDDSLNAGALGFEPLLAATEDDILDADLATLAEKLPEGDMSTMHKALRTLGHVGEGHCYEATGGFTGQ
ncbi:MAG: DUF4382 domain-containing protein [Chloroflexota bacterium]